MRMRLLGDRVECSRKATRWIARYPDIFYVPERRLSSTCAKAWCDGRRATAQSQQLTLRADTTYVLPCGFRIRLEKQIGRVGVAAGGCASARNVVPQAVHGFGRRQIGDFEIHRARDSERAGVRQRLPTRYRRRWRRS